MLGVSGFNFEALEQKGTQPAAEPITEPQDQPADAPEANNDSHDSKSESTTTDAPPAASFDEAAWIKEHFGLSSKEEIKAILEKSKELEPLTKRAKELEDALASAYVDDYAKAENEFVRKGGDRKVFQKINSLEIDKLTPEQAVAEQMKMEYPELSDSEIQRKIIRKYKLGEGHDPEDEEVQDARSDLKIDGKKSREYLAKYKVEASVPPSDKLLAERQKAESDLKIKRDQSLSQWASTVEKVVGEVQSVNIPIDDQGSVLDYKFKDVNATELKEKTFEVIKNLGLDHTEQSFDFAKTIVLNSLKTQHDEKMFVAACNRRAELERDNVLKEYGITNPSSQSKGNTPPAKATNLDEQRAFAEKWAKGLI